MSDTAIRALLDEWDFAIAEANDPETLAPSKELADWIDVRVEHGRAVLAALREWFVRRYGEDAWEDVFGHHETALLTATFYASVIREESQKDIEFHLFQDAQDQLRFASSFLYDAIGPSAKWQRMLSA